jgi:hypothetical protein
MALTALAVTRAKAPGLYGDGNGLYLQVSRVGSKSWLLRFRLHGRRRDMGLGALADVSLADARLKAQDARKLVAAGIDPIDARHETRAKIAVEKASALTFKAAAESYIEAHSPGWRNEKHRDQWPNTLRDYVYPTIGKIPVAAVNVSHVAKILEPIWTDLTGSFCTKRFDRN